MNKLTMMQNPSEKNAQKYFRRAEQSPETAKKIQRNERAADSANTARLRALRLAKEALEKEAADQLAAKTAEAKPTKRRARAAAPRKVAPKRMFY